MFVPDRRLFFRSLLALCLGIALVSCDQGGGMEEDLTPEEASQRIHSAVDGLGESMETLEGGDFSLAVKGFLGLQNGEATSADWASRLVSELESVLRISDGRFDFEGSTGEYAWDPETESWSHTSESGSVILRFPASPEASGNNATFTLSSYSDTDLTVDGESVYVPTMGEVSLSIDDTDVFSVDLSNVDYTTVDGVAAPIPQSFGLSIFTAPHTHSFTLEENSSTDFDFSFDLSNGDERVAGLTVSAQLASDEYDELEGSDVETLSGEGRIGPDLTIPYTIQAGELAAFDDPSEEQINDRIDAVVQYRDREIATLRYDKDSEEVELVFADGTVEPAAAFFEDFLREMETTWADYLDESNFDYDTVQETVSKYVRP